METGLVSISLLILFIIILATACSETNFTKEELEKVVCTADVEECPDGSFVGRDQLNNCEFMDCP